MKLIKTSRFKYILNFRKMPPKQVKLSLPKLTKSKNIKSKVESESESSDSDLDLLSSDKDLSLSSEDENSNESDVSDCEIFDEIKELEKVLEDQTDSENSDPESEPDSEEESYNKEILTRKFFKKVVEDGRYWYYYILSDGSQRKEPGEFINKGNIFNIYKNTKPTRGKK